MRCTQPSGDIDASLEAVFVEAIATPGPGKIDAVFTLELYLHSQFISKQVHMNNQRRRRDQAGGGMCSY